MKFPATIFREYDIRGTVGDQLTPEVARAIGQALATLGWDRYVGIEGAVIGMRTFGASAPLKALAAEFGFTPDAVVRAARERIAAVAADQARRG